MSPAGLAIAAAAAAAGAAVNSAAGGGSFISFPTLVFLGVPPITANATNSVAMWLGGAGSIGGYRDLLEHPTVRVRWMLAVCVLGGVTGALLLLRTPPAAFSAIIPWLLLFSTLLFAAGPLIRRLTGGADADDVREPPYWALVPLFFCSVYGGFFGGGQGFLLLALFALTGMRDIHRANALKIVCSFVNNGVPLVPFILARALEWDAALAMCVGALVGGYYGARVVRRIPPEPLRWGIVALGAVMTVVFFRRA